nr:hypothetical protein [Tanacetum cinerariifolium]
DELYRDVDINQGRGLQVIQNIEDSHVILTPVYPDGPQESSSVSSFVTSMLNPISGAGVESIFTTSSSPIVSLQTPTPIMTPSTIAKITTSRDAPIPPITIPSIILKNLLTFNSAFRFDERLRSLETTFSEYRQTNLFVDAVSAILESVNATLEAEVLTRSSHSSGTSYAIAANLSEIELKKILIKKIKGNKSIQRSDEQRNLYKAEDERMMIRNDPPLDQTGGIKDEEKEGSMHQLALHMKQLPGVQADLPQGLNLDNCLPHPEWFSQPKRPPSPDRDWNKTLPAAQGDAQSWISVLARKTDARSSFKELLDTPIDFSNFIMNRLNVDTLTPALLAGPTYELMRGSCNSLTELEYHLKEVYKATTDQLDWVNPEGALLSRGEWKIFNWELKATRRGSTLRSPTRTDPI